MRDPAPTTIYLRDYTPPAFLVPAIDLDFAVHDDHVLVHARLRIERNAAGEDPRAPLVLDGDELELVAVVLDGRRLDTEAYVADTRRLLVRDVPDRFTLETTTYIRPQTNTRLMGLYASKDGLFTQCEPEGFRRITWFVDRPDVMSRYTTTIHADRARYPFLLSNGNPVDGGEEARGRHWVKWEDPFPKPSYLFAMVAGKLDVLRDTFVTRSGRTAQLAIFVEPGKLDQVAFAMQALKKSMKWDEEVFGLELDLDHFMIVAVGDFNMGAMENKGLNIFNTKYVLSRPDIATDADFHNIDRVVAHEYFHNWTGNRVTCRDWFQLSLKEGLTVFRDQEFSADMYSRPVQRIQEVRTLRAAQFAEDAGPMAHPVRPQSYMEIANFYTATVYEKGAEVVRMIHTLLGAERFRKGMDLYFARHDGQAVTCDDFVAAMADASGVDLTQFKRWYDQAGTPVVAARGNYDARARTYTLTLEQHTPPTPNQSDKLPLHIPLALGLVGGDGKDVAIRLEGDPTPPAATRVLSFTQTRQTFRFVDVRVEPVPSIARGFSAPVIVRYDYSEDDLTHLMAHDSDAFNRWEAAQRLATKLILRDVEARRSGRSVPVPASFVTAFGRVLADGRRDPAFAAEALSLPAESYLAEQIEIVDPDALHESRNALLRRLAHALKSELGEAYHALAQREPYSPDAASSGRRALKNLALGYLMQLDDPGVVARCEWQLDNADNMTDALAALTAIANRDIGVRVGALERFYSKWKDEPLVVDKWLRVQATSQLPGTLAEVRRLAEHESFNIRNPNKVYALLAAFGYANHVRFHAADGSGYAFLAERVIELDPINPQVAARLARAFDRWKKFDFERQALAREALERIRDTPGLSKDVSEIVLRSLA
jgi:aminopeptidase N